MNSGAADFLGINFPRRYESGIFDAARRNSASDANARTFVINANSGKGRAVHVAIPLRSIKYLDVVQSGPVTVYPLGANERSCHSASWPLL